MLKNSTDGPGDNPARGAVGFANDCCNIVDGVGDGSEADPPQGGDGDGDGDCDGDGSEADPPQGGGDGDSEGVGDGDGDDATSPTGTSYVRGVRRLRMTYSPGFLGCGLT